LSVTLQNLGLDPRVDQLVELLAGQSQRVTELTRLDQRTDRSASGISNSQYHERSQDLEHDNPQTVRAAALATAAKTQPTMDEILSLSIWIFGCQASEAAM
jgi:hypothetical protein